MDTAFPQSQDETSVADRCRAYSGLNTFMAMVRSAPEFVIGDKVFRALTDPYTGDWVVRNFGGEHFCLRLKPGTTLETIQDILRTSLEGKAYAEEHGLAFASVRAPSVH